MTLGRLLTVARSYHDERNLEEPSIASSLKAREPRGTRAGSIWPEALRKVFPSAWRSLDFVAMPSRQFLRGMVTYSVGLNNILNRAT